MYIDALIERITCLEDSQLKIKACDDFLQENAARKKSYLDINYYEQRI